MNRSAASISERTSRFLAWLLFAACSISAVAGTLQLVSVRSPALAPPSAANGDSWVHSLSSDGRFVLFASTARNLVSVGSNQPLPSYGLGASDVFLHDREQRKTELVSVSLAADGGGNASSIPYGLSTNLQWVLFESSATNLVSGDTNGTSDIFLRDRLNRQTVLVSVATNGLPGNSASRNATMTPDGRHVAFVSDATDLVPNDSNGIADVFVRDMDSGTTTLASVGAKRTGSESDAPIITPDGRYVVFYSTATNLVPGMTNGHVYVRDRLQGQTVCVSAAYNNAPFFQSYSPAITDDGQTVVYEASGQAGLLLRYSLATATTQVIHTNMAAGRFPYAMARNLEMTPDGRYVAIVGNTNGTTSTTCILVWDAQTGAFDLASGQMDGTVADNTTSDSISMDASGRFVSFLSDGLLTTNSTGDFHLFVRDRQTGTTVLVDAGTNGEPASVGPFEAAAMSENGTLIAFECLDGPLTPGDSNSAYDVFLRDLGSGKIEMISLRDAAFESLTPDGRSSIFPSAFTADGQKVVFVSDAGDVVSHDTNTVRDVFVRDLTAQTTELVSVNTNGLPADGASTEPAISPDGRWVVFTSWADDLVPADSNNRQDVFLRDLQSGTTAIVSVNTNGLPGGNNDSFSPVISSDGSSVLFRSWAKDLAPGPYETGYSSENLFLRDLKTGVTLRLSARGASTAVATTPDQSRIAFVALGFLPTPIYVWDRSLWTRIYTNPVPSVTAVSLSPDGSKLAYATNGSTQGEVAIVDLATKTPTSLALIRASSRPGLGFSADNKFLVVSATVQAGGKNQVYLFDLERGTNSGISRNYETGSPANGNSDMPEISSDGRFIAYRSEAADIVPGDLNGVPDIILFDRLSGLTVLVSSSQFGPSSADNRSLTPVFSRDGRTLAFTSWASDLLPGDFNRWSDVFALNLYSSAPIPLFSASVHPEAQGCCVTWPAQPGKYYRVQFKSSLSDTEWQDLWGLPSLVGNQGLLHEQPPGAAQRFYRVVAY